MRLETTVRLKASIESSTGTLINSHAERALLGRLLVDDRLWLDISDKVRPQDFGERRNEAIFLAMEMLFAAGRTITHATVVAELGEKFKKVDGIDASTYLSGLFAEAAEQEIRKVPIGQFVDVIVHRSVCRQLVNAGEQIKQEAQTATLSKSIDEVRQSAARLLTLTETADQSEDSKLGDLVASVIIDAEDTRRTGKRPGIQTGFSCFDELAGTLLPGNLVVLAGETGSGKTALATQLGLSLADQGIGVRMTSLEMEGKEIAARVLATYSAIETEKIIDGNLSPADFKRLMDMGTRVLDLPFWIDSRPRQSASTIQARLARAKARFGVKVGIVDHLQYVRSDLSRGEERERIAQVVDDHKAIAKRLQMVIFLVSHVSRHVDFSSINSISDVKRPSLSSLYGSSAIEKAADVTVFVHRPAWFLERASPNEKSKDKCAADLLEWEGKAELVLPKRRNGKGFGVRTCYFQENLTWFSEKRMAELDPLQF